MTTMLMKLITIVIMITVILIGMIMKKDNNGQTDEDIAKQRVR